MWWSGWWGVWGSWSLGVVLVCCWRRRKKENAASVGKGQKDLRGYYQAVIGKGKRRGKRRPGEWRMPATWGELSADVAVVVGTQPTPAESFTEEDAAFRKDDALTTQQRVREAHQRLRTFLTDFHNITKAPPDPPNTSKTPLTNPNPTNPNLANPPDAVTVVPVS